MLLDLHTHSTASDDSRATVEQYVKWGDVIRKKGGNIDGFVLTEHRQFDHNLDYSRLSSESGLLILKGAELDTDSGHFLVYGITSEITNRLDFSNVNLRAVDLVYTCDEYGAIAIPAHPGRTGIGFAEFIKDGVAEFQSIRTVELLNGSNRPGEGERAEQLVEKYGFRGTGGSDAHIVSAIGTCMTKFASAITNEQDLVKELRSLKFEAVTAADTSN